MKSRWQMLLTRNKLLKVRSQPIIAHKELATNYSYFLDHSGAVMKGYYHPLHYEADFLVEDSEKAVIIE